MDIFLCVSLWKRIMSFWPLLCVLHPIDWRPVNCAHGCASESSRVRLDVQFGACVCAKNEIDIARTGAMRSLIFEPQQTCAAIAFSFCIIEGFLHSHPLGGGRIMHCVLYDARNDVEGGKGKQSTTIELHRQFEGRAANSSTTNAHAEIKWMVFGWRNDTQSRASLLSLFRESAFVLTSARAFRLIVQMDLARVVNPYVVCEMRITPKCENRTNVNELSLSLPLVLTSSLHPCMHTILKRTKTFEYNHQKCWFK